jgi:hypothetical protein
VVNSATGIISAATTAISAGSLPTPFDALNLVNRVVINGSIVTNGLGSSTINTNDGIINGNITLGGGDDIVTAKFGTSANPISLHRAWLIPAIGLARSSV